MPVTQRLRLLHAAEVPPAEGWRSGRVPLGYGIGLVACVGIPLFWAVMFFTSKPWVSPLGWVLLPLMATVSLAVCLAIGLGCVEHLRAAVRADNWLAQLGDEGVYLHLRSWLNWRFPRHMPTVVFVPFERIETVHEVRETFIAQLTRSRTQRYHAYTVLTLREGTDTSALDVAVRGELLLVPPQAPFFTSFRAWDDVPVHVRRPGEIWVEWRSTRLLHALARRAPQRPREHVRTAGDMTAAHGGPSEVRRHALDVLYRGRRADAERVLRAALGLEVKAATDMLTNILKAGG